jgi:uncharacterized protein
MPPSGPLDGELDDDELMELDDFLSRPEIADGSLDVFSLEGFFTAILASPRLIPPSEWTPWMWDADQGELSPEFETIEQAQRIMELVMRLYNSVARALLPGAGEFEPLFPESGTAAATNWCIGFIAGTRFEPEVWADRIDERPKWFAPILSLGLEDEEGAKPRKSQLERWARDVGPAVTKIQAHWWNERQTAGPLTGTRRSPAGPSPNRSTAAPGRNDPCPCGSGRKFKRCCGAGPAAVH